jgi:hypothetical protein
VPLLVEQAASAQTDEWLSADGQLALWTLTPVEVVSAIRRLSREGALPEETAAEAEARIDEVVRASHLVIDIEGVKAQARRLLRLHPLRSADSLQLGAALEWAHSRPAGRVFHTLDGRLGLAAQREGFRVIPAPAHAARTP